MNFEMQDGNDQGAPVAEPVTLESWKQIAAYVQRDTKTARRWEREEGLPVHRHSHSSRSSVYAFPGEIDAWRAMRGVVPEPAPPPPLWKTLLAPPRSLAFGATMLLCLVMVGNGIRPPQASAQERQQVVRQVWAVPDAGGNSVSSDGRYLSFSDSTGDLAIRDLTTGANRRLTDTGGWEKSGDFAGTSVISPSGSQIAYEWYSNKEGRRELRVLSIAGAQPKAPRVLLPTASGREGISPMGWTPDEHQLLVKRTLPDRMEQLGMISLEDGSYRALKSSWRFQQPRLSPDGRWVAYGGLPEKESQVFDIYVLSTDGTRETAVVQNTANDVPMEWSPDGSHLYFVSTRTGEASLWSVPVQSGKAAGAAELVRPNTGALYTLGMTRSGAFYYRTAVNGGTNIFAVELGPDGTAIQAPALLSERLVNSTFGARVSPDGKSLAYYSIRTGPEHLVIIRTIETGQERDFRPSARLPRSAPAWFPDGRSLLITEYDFQKPGTTFVRLNVSSGEEEVLLRVNEPVDFKLSRDGKTLYYLSYYVEPTDRMARTRLVRHDLASGRENELSRGESIAPAAIAVSPDGQQLAYYVRDTGNLVVMPAAGGPPIAVLSLRAHPVDALDWTPDGKFFVFSRSGDNASPASLWRIPVEGGEAVALGASLKGTSIREPQVAPDGRRVHFTVIEPNTNEVWALENFIPAAGTAK